MSDSKVIRTLFLTIIAEVISFGVLIPIAPLLFTEPGSTFYMLSEGVSIQIGYVLLGLLIGLYPLGQFFATPILGEISDIYGRKKVIQVSVFGTVISSIVFGLGIMFNSIAVLFASRVLNGLTGGLVSVSQATIADITEDDKKSKNFGIIGMAFGIGFIFGPFLGGFLSSDFLHFFSVTTPFWFAAAVSTISLLYVTKSLHETSPMEDKKINWKKPFTQLKKGWGLPGLKKLFTANFFYFSGFAFFTTFIPVYLVKNFGFSQFQTGNFFLYIGILLIIGQGYIVPKLFSRFEEENVMPFTLFLTGLFIFLQPVPQSIAVFLAVVTLFQFNNSVTQISLNTLVSNKAADKDQGLALGTNQSVRALGNAVPSMLSGIAAAIATPAFPLTLAGLTVMATAAGYWKL
ncbi:MFS transporter [Candidatus Nanohalobium constans]|uniref:MFS transporter, DHA1 family, tetracycline resistance protein n=1 Tax=Candidatus Nanohalobium constans TaxID=2565781 RepID=A0A5Q0UG13_9ARCH|nr:MFS transporter [Candidatus Nanohalobium constans]QGA80536.1 MFS transporter, DHA1 family, tetracycline resistance protein [Candidatus Nanohalobium constans]